MRNHVGASPTGGGTGLDSTEPQFRLPVTLIGEPGYYQTVGRDSSVTHANTMVSQRKGHHGRPGHTMLEWTCRIAQRYSPMTLARVSWIGARQWGRDRSDAHATSRLS